MYKRELGEMVTCQCDGGCSPNPGVGGWGWVIVPNGEYTDYGGVPHTSSDVMELWAILECIKYWQRDLIIETDSQYAINVIWQRYYPDANQELVYQIRRLIRDNNIAPRKIPGAENGAHALAKAGRLTVEPPPRPTQSHKYAAFFVK